MLRNSPEPEIRVIQRIFQRKGGGAMDPEDLWRNKGVYPVDQVSLEQRTPNRRAAFAQDVVNAGCGELLERRTQVNMVMFGWYRDHADARIGQMPRLGRFTANDDRGRLVQCA